MKFCLNLRNGHSFHFGCLESFEEKEQIIIESNNQYSVISICKYDIYQNNTTNLKYKIKLIVIFFYNY
jgi:hypothetical protein